MNAHMFSGVEGCPECSYLQPHQMLAALGEKEYVPDPILISDACVPQAHKQSAAQL